MKHQEELSFASVLTPIDTARIQARMDNVGIAEADLLPATLIADLRTDHAGESGAVMIYRGILAASRDDGVRRFATSHLATEEGHLAEIEPLLTPRQRSRLLPLWRIAGWIIGDPRRTMLRAIHLPSDRRRWRRSRRGGR